MGDEAGSEGGSGNGRFPGPLPLEAQKALAELYVAVVNHEDPKLVPEACEGCNRPICSAIVHSLLDDYRIAAHVDDLASYGRPVACSACGGPLAPPDYDYCGRCEAASWSEFRKIANVEAIRVETPEDIPPNRLDIEDLSESQEGDPDPITAGDEIVHTREGSVFADYPFYIVRDKGTTGPVWPVDADLFEDWYSEVVG